MTNYRHGSMIDLVGAIESPKLHVHRDRCLLVRNRNAECLRCVDVCTSGALSIGEEGVVVKPELCIGCGTCASACPSGCLEAASPTDGELFTAMATALAHHPTVGFACERVLAGADRAERPSTGRANAAETRSVPRPGAPVGLLPDGTTVIAVTCLGRVDESLIVEAVARGAKTVRLIGGSCATCSHHRGGSLCNEITASASALLEALGISSPIERLSVDELFLAPTHHTAEPPWKASEPHMKAAEPLLDGIRSNGQECDAATPERASSRSLSADPSLRTALKPGHGRDFIPKFTHVQADGTLPHFVPERRVRLFNSLKALGTPRKPTVTTRLWGQVDLDTELCRGCRMCTVFCPTGALARFDAPDGAFGVEHRSALCMQCRLCETICPERAITVTDTVDVREFLSGKKFRFTMLPLGWNPSSEDAIATRMARFIKTDTMQEPQAKVGANDVAKRRAYAWERERRRQEIREGSAD